jgi:hypothetical protein
MKCFKWLNFQNESNTFGVFASASASKVIGEREKSLELKTKKNMIEDRIRLTRIRFTFRRELSSLAGDSVNPFDSSAGPAITGFAKTMKKDEKRRSLEKGRIDRKTLDVGSGRCLENREPCGLTMAITTLEF